MEAFQRQQETTTAITITSTPHILLNTNWEDLDNLTTSNWTTPDTLELSSLAMGVYFAVRVLWGILAVLGNAITIIVVSRFEELHTNTNVLICNLAMADLLSGLMVPLMIVHQTMSESKYFVPVCLIEKTINLVSTAGNLLMILYISIDRYIYIAHPLHYPLVVTRVRTTILLTITWAYNLISTPLIVFFANHLHIGMPCKYAIFLYPSVYQFYLTPQFLILILLTFGFYTAIAKIAHNQARRIEALQQPDDTVEASISRSSKKISRMLGIVLGVYVLTILPQYLMTLTIRNRRTTTLLAMEKVTVIIYWANTWANPIIYVWRMKQFRIYFKKLFRRN